MRSLPCKAHQFSSLAGQWALESAYLCLAQSLVLKIQMCNTMPGFYVSPGGLNSSPQPWQQAFTTPKTSFVRVKENFHRGNSKIKKLYWLSLLKIWFFNKMTPTVHVTLFIVGTKYKNNLKGWRLVWLRLWWYSVCGREGMAVGVWSIWWLCVHSQEAEGSDSQCSALFLLPLCLVLDSSPHMVHSWLEWTFTPLIVFFGNIPRGPVACHLGDSKYRQVDNED